MKKIYVFCGHRDGYYDDNGQWHRTKYCFASCGDRCTCGPPGGLWYNPAKDTRPPPEKKDDAKDQQIR